MKKIIISALLVALVVSLAGQISSPVGKWKTIDDETGKPKSVVILWEENGILYGKIERLFRTPEEEQNPLCDECKGENKDKPIIGMTILEGLTIKNEVWSGGTILDPNNGKVYKCKIELIESGKRMKLRGFIGFSLLGRTQFWERIE
jgi:uncharacterized protein (DUF2147 family)